MGLPFTTDAVTERIARDVAKEEIKKGGHGGEPAQYLKDAQVNNNTLTLTKKDGSNVEFTPQGGGSEPEKYLKDIEFDEYGFNITNKDGEVFKYQPQGFSVYDEFEE